MPGLFRYIALTLIACQPLLAGGDTLLAGIHPDTVFRYREVVVSAERYPVSAWSAGAVSYAARSTEAWGFAGPGGALASMRNLHLLSYGGGMALQTLSIRGMGSEHTMVLWNGLPAGNLQAGVADFNLFNAADIEAIEVVPGGSSALHGSGAVGGVVNLLPRFPYATRPGLEFGVRTGSFGEAGVSARATLRPDTAVGIALRAGRTRSRGDFSFTDPGGGADVIRHNGDFLSQSVSLSAGWDPRNGDRVGVMMTALSLDQGAPGPWSGGVQQSGARRNDKRYVAAIAFESATSSRLGLTATGIFDRQYERFLDRGGSYPADNHYQTAWAGVSGQLRYQASSPWLLMAGLDLSQASAGGNAMNGPKSRGTAAFSGAVSCVIRAAETLIVTITPALRWEGSTTFPPHLSPKIGLNVEMSREVFSLRAHSTAGTGRREATMNELYYSGEGGRGNPSIDGESSVSYDLGLGGHIGAVGAGIVWDVTHYQISMEDRIQWLPTETPRVWAPANLGKTRSWGWEFGTEWKIVPGEVEFSAEYSIIDAKKASQSPYGSIEYVDQLIYIPLDKGSLGVLLGRRDISGWLRGIALSLEAIHTGERFLLENQSEALPSHKNIRGSVIAELGLPSGTIVVHYAAENLANLDYSVMPGYPMPGFNHSVSIHYKLTI